jgi:hypothetical protein
LRGKLWSQQLESTPTLGGCGGGGYGDGNDDLWAPPVDPVYALGNYEIHLSKWDWVAIDVLDPLKLTIVIISSA